MRGRLSEDLRSITDVKVIFRQQPATTGGQHFGSRLVFDRTGALFVTTGDRGSLRALAQQPDNHIGKIIRITEDGGIPPDNPKVEGWLPEIWSIGHRNLQGAAIHPETGRLWTVEHGAKGGDELNIPAAGKNYGWPDVSYGREYSGEPIGAGLTEKQGSSSPSTTGIHRSRRPAWPSTPATVSRMEGQPLRRRAGAEAHRAPHARWQQGGGRRASVRRTVTHPRREAGSRRISLRADG